MIVLVGKNLLKKRRKEERKRMMMIYSTYINMIKIWFIERGLCMF